MPAFRAMASGASYTSVTAVKRAPEARATIAADRPTGPAPSTAAAPPARRPESPTACTPTCSGSRSAASSQLTESGSTRHCRPHSRQYSAMAPG